MDEKPPSSGKCLKSGTFRKVKAVENAMKIHRIHVFYPKIYKSFHAPGGGIEKRQGVIEWFIR